MELTKRQGKILNKIVEEYIELVEPVSSKLLEKKYDFGVCPATIRIEMQKLTDTGFISQPHTSAGRIPTDKGYRFFVDNLFQKGFLKESYDSKIKNWVEDDREDTVKFLQNLTKNLASFSSSLVLAYLFDEGILWEEGWEEVFQEPEFKEQGLISNFAQVIKSFEQEIDDFEDNLGLKVYIGRENPFSKVKEFSIILSGCHFPNNEKGILALMGPKRMAYDKNINSLNSLVGLLEKL